MLRIMDAVWEKEGLMGTSQAGGQHGPPSGWDQNSGSFGYTNP